VSASGEVRLVPVSREQRDWHAKQAISLRGQVEWFTTHLDGDGATAASREAKQHEALVAAWDAAAGGEAAAERSLSSRGDAVWTVDDLPHLLDEPEDDVVAEIDRTAGGERPSVSLREVGQVSWCLTHEGPARYWSSLKTDGGPPGFCGKECRIVTAFVQVEREAEEGERDE
jgi:hypothetical protein